MAAVEEAVKEVVEGVVEGQEACQQHHHSRPTL
jgi:hypothetical protein